jgi:hypothetical protein
METHNKSSYLSKSLFIKGVQCHKALYLRKYYPELSDPVPASREALFRSGSEVGIIAHGLFPGGVEIPFEAGNYDMQVRLTQEAIANGAETIYEASFNYDGIFVKVDILHKGTGGWELYEVKSSTGFKDIYQPDLSVQYYVLNGAGIPVTKAFLVHINNQYARQGDIDPFELFSIVDMTDSVTAFQHDIGQEIQRQKEMLMGDVPKIDIGPWCSNPYDCDFKSHCWQHIPEMSVFSLRGNRVLQYSLYNQGRVSLDDVVPSELPAAQRQQVEAIREKTIYSRKDEIRDFLDSLWYPLYFLDFETFADAVPRFDVIRPYQNVPYQYSLHYLEDESAPLGHHEYLAQPGIDPRAELTAKLMSQVPDNACVLAYVASFEKGVLQDLACWLLEYADKIERITSSLIDLAYPFQNRLLYHWQFNGSYSIKSVLPALVPELGYDTMEIRNREMAGIAYAGMQKSSDQEEIEQIRKALLKYCRLDTFAMVKLLEALKNCVR